MRGSDFLLRNTTVLILGLLLCAASALAQINTGRISGLVTDASGAAVPGAVVRGINQATEVVTATESSANGEYLLNFLVPGAYRVEIESKGFQKAVQTGVTVNAGGVTRLDISLKVGELQQVVEVQSQQLAIATETSELSQTFTKTDLDNLPNIDRNPLFQMNLMPGAYSGSGSGNYGNNGGENGSAIGNSRAQLASLGGTDANATSVFVEGTFNREPQNGYVGVVPAIEGIEEVQVYTGKYNAEYGFSGSAVVNVVTKAGTNEYHGSVFEYLRNDAADARPFFAKSKTPFRRNQFGGAMGGPIKKNKLFFFADYQGTYFNTSGAGYTSAPTDKMYQGDFSELYNFSQLDGAGNPLGQIYDPFTRQFDADGNVIAATPFPNNVIPSSRWDPATAKMNNDFIFGKANLSGTDNNLYYITPVKRSMHQGDARIDYNRSDKNRFFVRYSVLKSIQDYSTDINKFWQADQADSDTLNQNTQFTHQWTLSPSKMNELRLSYNRTAVNTATKSMDQEYNNYYGIPNGNLGDPITRGIFNLSSLEPLHNIGTPDWVAFIKGNTISVTENFTWIKRRHNMKFGANINWVENTSADTMGGESPRGTLGFDAAMTSYDGNNVLPYAYPSFLLGTPTLSTRARFVNGWPYQTYWQNAWYAQDDFKVHPTLTLNLGLRYEISTRPIERFNRQSNWDTRTNELVLATDGNRSPAIQLDKKNWGPRIGFAWSPDRGKTSLRGGYGISYWQDYWDGPLTILGLTYPHYSKGTFTSASNLIPSLQLSRDGIPLATAEYDETGALVIPPDAVIRGADYGWRQQRVDQVSMNLERELRKGIVLDVGYLGVLGRNNNRVVNINQAPPGPAGEDYQLRRPLYSQYPQLGDIPISSSKISSNYHALTARLSANINKYVFVYATYAHARSLAEGQNIDQNDLHQYYGPTSTDVQHIFNSQFTVELPLGKGKLWGANMNPVLDKIIGGWQYSGFLFIRSGTRFGVGSPVSTLHNGQGNRPDRIADGNLPPDQRTLSHWYDITAFVNHTEEQTYGNAGTNPLFADGQVQLDSSIFKNFRITERTNLQFRFDMFNTFNHPDFSPPRARVGASNNGVVSSTSTDPRRLEFGLRLSF